MVDVLQLLALFPLVAAIGYAALLLYLLAWGARPGQPVRAFGGYLALSAAWALLLSGTAPEPAFNLPVKLLAAGTLLLGVASGDYLDWSRARRWAWMPGLAILAALLLDLSPSGPVAIPLPLAAFVPTAGGWLAFALWIGLSFVILARTWLDYRRAYFPWHANRLLHWVVFVSVAVAGEALVFANDPWAPAAGHLVRFLATVILLRAVTNHRLFDIRANLRRSLAYLLLVLASAVPAALVLTATLVATGRLQLSQIGSYLLILSILVLGFVLYQPFRRLLERLLYSSLLGRELQTSQVVRRYSQAISRTLDVDQLSALIIGTVSELLATTRGALLLVSVDDDGYLVEPVPAIGNVPRGVQRIAADSPLLEPLARGRVPLLQYDVDFNPAYAGVSAAERGWLEEMAMDVYVPIHTEDRLSGLIALGPKGSGLPYRADELELVELLADQTVIALQNARLFSELNQQHDRIRFLNTDLRRQNDRLEVLDRVKTDFITIASHELRTPLTQVRGYADLLKAMNEETGLSREQTREIAGNIIRASARLESVIAAMLDASQLEISGLQLMLVPTRMQAVLEAAAAEFSPALRQRNLLLEMQGIATLPTVRGDYRRLVQAFANLIGNAIKYTPDHGTVTVEGTVVPGDDGAQFVEIVVADTGIGIDPQFHQLIFEKFFRIGDPELHSTGMTKYKGAGPGLGLHIAKGVVEAHGGSIWVESDGEDEERLPGSRFHVILPTVPPWRQGQTDLQALQAEQAERYSPVSPTI